MSEQPHLLRQINHQRAESLSGIDRQQFSVDTDEPLSDRQKPYQRAQKRGLPHPFFARNTGKLTVLCHEGQPFCQRLSANGNRSIFYLNHRLCFCKSTKKTLFTISFCAFFRTFAPKL